MPLLLVFAAGGVAGFFVADGMESGSRLLRWGAVAGAGYIAAKHFKVI